MLNFISIIVPVYNVEDYIEKCIDSIVNQTYKNIEVILVDDGSTDLSGKICDHYAKNDSRIKVIHKNNEGLSSSRNSGLNNATGDFIAFVDGDDYISPTMYEMLFELINKYHADISMCGTISVDHEGKFLEEKQNDPNKKIILKGDEIIDAYLADFDDYKRVAVTVCNKLFRRSLFDQIRFLEGKYFEDTFIGYEILRQCSTLAITTKAEYFYVQRSASISHQVNSYWDFLEANNLRYQQVISDYPYLELKCRKMTLLFFLCALRGIVALGIYAEIKEIMECIRKNIQQYEWNACGLNADDEREIMILCKGVRNYYVIYKAIYNQKVMK